jgi:hypothetical protein
MKSDITSAMRERLKPTISKVLVRSAMLKICKSNICESGCEPYFEMSLQKNIFRIFKRLKLSTLNLLIQKLNISLQERFSLLWKKLYVLIISLFKIFLDGMANKCICRIFKFFSALLFHSTFEQEGDTAKHISPDKTRNF